MHNNRANTNKSYIIPSDSFLAKEMTKFQQLVLDNDNNSDPERDEASFIFRRMAYQLPFDIYRNVVDSWSLYEKNPESLQVQGQFEATCRKSIQQLKNGYVWSCNQ